MRKVVSWEEAHWVLQEVEGLAPGRQALAGYCRQAKAAGKGSKAQSRPVGKGPGPDGPAPRGFGQPQEAFGKGKKSSKEKEG